MKRLINIIIEGITLLFIFFSLITFTNIIKIPLILSIILYHSLFLIILVLWLLKVLIYKGEELIKKTFLDLPLVFLILTAIILTEFSVYKRLSKEYVFNLSMYIIFCLFIIHNFNNPKQLERILIVILMPLVIIGLGGIVEFIKNVEFNIFIKTPFSYRIESLAGHPNRLAILMGSGILISLGFILNSKERNSKLLFAVFTIILSICLFLCFSIGGYLQIFVAILLLGILIKKIKINKLFILILSILIVLFLARIIFIPTATKESTLGRLFIWNVTSQMIKDKPLTGVGLGNFNDVYPWYYIEHPLHENYPIFTYHHAHNSLLHLCSEAGFIFIFILFWIIILILINIRKLYEYNDRQENMIGFIAGCILIGFMVSTIHEHFIDFLHPIGISCNLIFWSALGIFTAFINMKNNFNIYYRKKIILLIILGLIIIHSLNIIITDRARIFYIKGLYWYMKGKFATAATYYKKSLKLTPGVFPYHVSLGHCFYQIGINSKSKKIKNSYINRALKEYKKALTLNPYHILLYKYIASAYISSNQIEIAHKYLKIYKKYEKYESTLKYRVIEGKID